MVENILFSAIFGASPPPEKLKSKKKKKKKKKGFQILGPPLTNSWTRACCYTCNVLYTCSKYSISVESALSPVACPGIRKGGGTKI